MEGQSPTLMFVVGHQIFLTASFPFDTRFHGVFEVCDVKYLEVQSFRIAEQMIKYACFFLKSKKFMKAEKSSKFYRLTKKCGLHTAGLHQ